MLPVATIIISAAAEAVHPGLTEAVNSVGGGKQNLGSCKLRVTAKNEGSGDLTVARTAVPIFTPAITRVDGETPGSTMVFETADQRFAAALIVAIALDEAGPAAAHPVSLALHSLARRVAARDVSVLIGGPTGTGKEVLARLIHASSPRRNAAFIAVNCAALPEAMLEALLFGHERGAFTGAAGSAKGLFRAAHGGTLLLDEVAELPLTLQAKLLRTLQEREVLPIGATLPTPIDVRVIAAANRDLLAEVAANRFRSDLYYRLAVFPLTIAPLTVRRADIVPITAALWLRQGLTAWPTPAALARLEAHDWPGNVRELGNVLSRAAVLTEGPRIEAHDIVFDTITQIDNAPASLGGRVREREFDVIRSTLAECAGRRGETANRLGISERTLRYKLAAMSTWHLPSPVARNAPEA